MSYAKKGSASDVYVYRAMHGDDAPEAVLVTPENAADLPDYPSAYVCHECLLMPELTAPDRAWDREHYTTTSAEEIVAHLERHLSLGHQVPSEALDRLRFESRRRNA